MLTSRPFQFRERPGGIRWKRGQLERVVLSLMGWIVGRFLGSGGTRAKATSLLQLIQNWNCFLGHWRMEPIMSSTLRHAVTQLISYAPSHTIQGMR
jgi:hypothetical protein